MGGGGAPVPAVLATALEEVAADYPDTKFAIIDMVVDQPNVRSVV